MGTNLHDLIICAILTPNPHTHTKKKKQQQRRKGCLVRLMCRWLSHGVPHLWGSWSSYTMAGIQATLKWELRRKLGWNERSRCKNVTPIPFQTTPALVEPCWVQTCICYMVCTGVTLQIGTQRRWVIGWRPTHPIQKKLNNTNTIQPVLRWTRNLIPPFLGLGPSAINSFPMQACVTQTDVGRQVH